MTVDVLRPADLTADQLRAWGAFQEADPDVAGPFLTPDWAQAVERAGGGRRVRVAVQHEAGRPRAFLAVRAGPFTAMPVGAPMSDYQGIVAAPGVRPDLDGMLRALGVSRYDFSVAPASQAALSRGFAGRAVSRMIDLEAGWEPFAAGLKARGSDLLRDVAKKQRRMGREVGEPVFTLDDRDRTAFDAMMRWKRDQYRRTGQTDVLARPWVGRLMDEVWARPALDTGGERFGALFSTLRLGDRLAAAHLALRRGPVVHAWYIAHDPALARHSPGMVMDVELVRALAGHGAFREFDYGAGDYAFKERLCNRERAVAYGAVGLPSPSLALRSAAYGARRWAETSLTGRAAALPGKAMRRWDVIRALA